MNKARFSAHTVRAAGQSGFPQIYCGGGVCGSAQLIERKQISINIEAIECGMWFTIRVFRVRQGFKVSAGCSGGIGARAPRWSLQRIRQHRLLSVNRSHAVCRCLRVELGLHDPQIAKIGKS